MEMWRTNKKWAWMEQAQALRARLEAEMKAEQQGSGLRQLQLIMAGLMRGEKGAALQAMCIGMADEQRGREVAAMLAVSDERLRSAAIMESGYGQGVACRSHCMQKKGDRFEF